MADIRLPTIYKRDSAARWADARLAKDVRSMRELNQSLFDIAKSVHDVKEKIHKNCDFEEDSPLFCEKSHLNMHRGRQQTKNYLNVKIPCPTMETESDEAVYKRSKSTISVNQTVDSVSHTLRRRNYRKAEIVEDVDSDEDNMLSMIKKTRSYRSKSRMMSRRRDERMVGYLNKIVLRPLKPLGSRPSQ
eukprot:CAMPEP_0114988860 /NCGR_PEP_ID=MMETSP0216-20121206/9854_1 /TAXON_ID=223996 /ORGANISM="Protocruzia adherens, Strain Boccale" /LENGTH=188 /DNA_ID=CAMNT_0002351729 /DNA_START=73 /DNA_END=639 /DNA_ORIENTATION=+